MHDLAKLRKSSGVNICKTIASPITILDYLEMSEVLTGLLLIFLFGVIKPEPTLLVLLLLGLWGIWPQFRERFESGFVLHYLYSNWNLKVVGMLSPPKGNKLGV